MSSRMRKKETVRLSLSCGDWVDVKKHITAGDQRRMFRRMIHQGARGDEIDPVMVGPAKLAVYVLDWSITDAEDRPIRIREMTEEARISAFDELPPEDFAEILQAVEAHDSAMDALRAEEKKIRADDPKSSAISPLPDYSDGAMNGSPNSTETSIAFSSRS
jgi:hypothetical protein